MSDNSPYYTTGEGARIGWVVAKAAARIARGGDPSKYDAELDAIKAKAQLRADAEKAAREKVEADRLAEKAKKKAERWF